ARVWRPAGGKRAGAEARRRRPRCALRRRRTTCQCADRGEHHRPAHRNQHSVQGRWVRAPYHRYRVAAVIAADPIPRAADAGHVPVLRDVTYTYPGSPLPAVGSIDLGVAVGEFVCLLGPSGCGKTTLLRLVAGLLRPNGRQIGARRDYGPRATVAWMAQSDGRLPWRTG